MAYLLDVRKEIASFALLMEAKLRKNDKKYGGNSWNHRDSRFFLQWIDEERDELEKAIFCYENNNALVERRNVAEEAADVANYALMAADCSGGLAQEAGGVQPYVAPEKPDNRTEEKLVAYFNSEEGADYGQLGDQNNWDPAECAIEVIHLLETELNKPFTITEQEAERLALRVVSRLARKFPDISFENLEDIAGTTVGLLFPHEVT